MPRLLGGDAITLRVVRISRPRRLVVVARLIAPRSPAAPRSACEQFEVRTGRAGFNQLVLLVGLAGMFALLLGDEIHLPPPRRQRARVLAANAEQDDFRDIAKIEADAPTVGAAVLACLVPDQVRLVRETPRLHHFEPVRQKRVGNPQVEMRSRGRDVLHGKRADLRQRHRAVAAQPPMLRRHLAGAVRELPRRIGENGSELRVPARKAAVLEIDC